ncbi:hypothetical protein [Nonomuraea sp. GTA35]|uniref:hypothetical protein n=1 Tax=Nonomuraea sp. GTA35 TaxID=1676746 RepID=UPI0035C21840
MGRTSRQGHGHAAIQLGRATRHDHARATTRLDAHPATTTPARRSARDRGGISDAWRMSQAAAAGRMADMDPQLEARIPGARDAFPTPGRPSLVLRPEGAMIATVVVG